MADQIYFFDDQLHNDPKQYPERMNFRRNHFWRITLEGMTFEGNDFGG